MNKIRIAQIGAGHDHATSIFRCIAKQKDVFEVVGYALPEGEEEKFPHNLKCFEGYKRLTVDEIMADKTITAVTIETEEVNLTKYALLAARNGKQIHMDKPGGTDYSEFKKLIDTVKENQLVFHLGYMYRYNPYVIELIEDIKSGKLGEIYSVEAQMNCKHNVHKRNWLGTFKGGMLFFLGCHLIDLIFQIQGEPENIIPLSRSTKIDGVTGEDFGMVVFEYKNGVSFAKTCAEEIGGFERRQLVVCGSKGTVELKPLEWYSDISKGLQFTKKNECVSENWGTPGVVSKTDSFDRYDTMMYSFADMCKGLKKNPLSYDYELRLYEILLKSCGVEF
ncbi:MAG: Gfo/Idh/MocA family oxidoreductase [Ruminococcaceae bacterium]|nr:Gfo/Idh/MocA family oxidoreductase [Oscillospiraceae bacterium]